MSRSIPALVKPALLIWAREQAGFSRLEDAAVKLNIEVGRPFASIVLGGYQRNAVSGADVMDYLGVQLKHLHKISEHPC